MVCNIFYCMTSNIYYSILSMYSVYLKALISLGFLQVSRFKIRRKCKLMLNSKLLVYISIFRVTHLTIGPRFLDWSCEKNRRSAK